MNNNDLLKKLAHLEFKCEMLESELGYLHQLLLKCGFPHGIETLKATVEDLLKGDSELLD